MKGQVNKHGLSRYIPADIRRAVRQRSKFGCVLCRCGLYQYEHIDPVFEDAKVPSPDRICCLCGSCHDLVTRGQISKKAVKAAYQRIQSSPMHKVRAPVGPLDFHDGSAELAIGGFLYTPAVHTIFRYHGSNIIQVVPGERHNEPGRISAIFTDEEGNEILRLEENEWVGSLKAWDIDIKGKRIRVRRRQGTVALQLRLEPPGKVVVEHLDMRFSDSHVLATEKTYAVGRYIEEEYVHWVHAEVGMLRSNPFGVAIEFTDPSLLEERDRLFRNSGKELSTNGRLIVMNSNAGIMIKPIGIAIASFCGGFDLATLAAGEGNRSLSDMRHVVFSHPEQLARFISTGKVAE